MGQILVTGMHRSGTTLCFDLLRRHPEVRLAVNEGVLFDRAGGKFLKDGLPSNRIEGKKRAAGARPGKREWLDPPDDPRAIDWVAKMSYPGPLILQEWCDSAERYVHCWLDCFGASARVVHMVRHPFAVFDSLRRRWAGDPVHLQNYGPITLESVCRDWAWAVSAMERVVSGERRVQTVLFEDLLESPERTLETILEKSGLTVDKMLIDNLLGQNLVFFGGIEKSRARAYRESSLETISRSTSWLLTPWFEKWGYADR